MHHLRNHALSAWCSFPSVFVSGYLHQPKKYYIDSLVTLNVAPPSFVDGNSGSFATVDLVFAEKIQDS